MRLYSLDLRDVCFGPSPMGGRRLVALILNLPVDSATAERIRRSSASVERQVRDAGGYRPREAVPPRPRAATRNEILRFFGPRGRR